MFRHKRLSRQPDKPVNLGALAAASAIGNALNGNGRTVDQKKIPQYNTNDPYSRARSPSSSGSRTSSNLDKRSSMRLNSLSNGERSSSFTNSVSHPTSRRSINSKQNNGNGNGGSSSRNSSLNSTTMRTRRSIENLPRTSSLDNHRASRIDPDTPKPKRIGSSSTMTNRHSSIESNASARRYKTSALEAKKTFQEFGGGQVPNVLTRSTSMQMKKYIPGPNGLVAVNVEVPIEEPVRSKKVLRRSVSTINMSNTPKHNALKQRTSSPSLKQQVKNISRTSSLNSLSSPHSMKTRISDKSGLQYSSPKERRTSSLNSHSSYSPGSKNSKNFNDPHEMHSYDNKSHNRVLDESSHHLIESTLEEETEIELENEEETPTKSKLNVKYIATHPVVDQSDMKLPDSNITPSKPNSSIRGNIPTIKITKSQDKKNYLFKDEIQNEHNKSMEGENSKLSKVDSSDETSPKGKEMRRLISDSILLEESMSNGDDVENPEIKDTIDDILDDDSKIEGIDKDIEGINDNKYLKTDTSEDSLLQKRVSKLSIASSDYASLNEEKREILKIFDEMNKDGNLDDMNEEQINELMKSISLSSVKSKSTTEEINSLNSDYDQESTMISEELQDENTSVQEDLDETSSDDEFHDSNLLAIDNISIASKNRETKESPMRNLNKVNSKSPQHNSEINADANRKEKSGELKSFKIIEDKSKRNSKLSPIKSALKKSTSNLNDVSIYNGNDSPANQAYLSLTTAENTRLNAGSMSSENLSRKPIKTKTNINSKGMPYPRTQSINSELNGPAVRTSVQPPSNRNSMNLSLNSSQGARNSNLEKVPKRHPGRRQGKAIAASSNSVQPSVPQQPSQKQSNRMSMNIKTTQLYPEEPTPKRSSFEKQRNADSKMGFKSMSLRDRLGTEQPEQHTYSHTPVSENIASGWKSRFQDSDDEDEGFMNNFSAPKPMFAESSQLERSMSENKSNKINNRISKLSLRSASMGDKVPKPVLNNPYSDNSPSRMSLRTNSLQKTNNDFTNANTPEKKTFGTKLKKLFGRKKEK